MGQTLLILDAGQYGSVVKEIAKAVGFRKIDFLDDAENSEQALNKPVGRMNDYQKLRSEYGSAIVAIGNATLRKEWTERLVAAGFDVPVLISPRAFVGETAVLHYGAVVEPMAVVHENATVGAGSFVSAGAVVNHNAVVSEYCHIDNNAVVMSGAVVAPMTKIDSLMVVLKNR